MNSVYKNHGNIKFLQGKYKILLLVRDNFLYKRTNGHFPRTTWQCTKGCEAFVITYAGVLESVKDIDSHPHPPLIEEIVIIETNMRIKERVETEFNLSPRQIHMQERTKLLLQNQDDAYLMMNSFLSSKSSLYRFRSEKFPKNPKHRNEIELEDNWQKTLRQDESFLLANDGIDNKIMIFGTHSNLRILCNAKYVISDGTFSIHPEIFSQLYVFHAKHLGKVLPLLFCLLPDKTYNTYLRLIKLIQNSAELIGSKFEPRKFHIDYEMSMIMAISEVFSSEKVQGCLFHYSQCLWRKVQELGLYNAYKQHKSVNQWIRRFSALPFLPVHDIDDGWIEITENSPNARSNVISQDQIDKFHNYMLATWISDCDAKFDRKMWNQYENEGPRTTNNAEGWNHKLNQQAKSRMSFYQFVFFLQNLQIELDATKFDLISESPSRGHNRYKILDEKISTAKLNYATGSVNILDFLDSISFALKLD